MRRRTSSAGRNEKGVALTAAAKTSKSHQRLSSTIQLANNVISGLRVRMSLLKLIIQQGDYAFRIGTFSYFTLLIQYTDLGL